MSHAAPVALAIVLRNPKQIKFMTFFKSILRLQVVKKHVQLKYSTNMFKHLVLSPVSCFNSFEVSQKTFAFVAKHFQNIIRFIGLNPALYKGFSFRIGAATHAAQLGYSENCIHMIGRWESDAIRRYIQLSSFPFHSTLSKCNGCCG